MKEEDWIKLAGPVSTQAIRNLERLGDIDKLSITQNSLLTTELARAFGSLKSVKQFHLWCDVTPPAMQYVTAIPGLRILDVLCIRHPGRLGSFQSASALEKFRCATGLTEQDLLAVCTCQSLCEIGAQSSTLSALMIEALIRLLALQSLNLEGTNFDDAMAEQMSISKNLRSLHVGATRITGRGLDAISRMAQLTSLDLWATRITENDLHLLARLPRLEYLSIGNVEGTPSLNADIVLPKLFSIPALQRIWLDGMTLRPDHRKTLEARYKTVRIT